MTKEKGAKEKVGDQNGLDGSAYFTVSDIKFARQTALDAAIAICNEARFKPMDIRSIIARIEALK